MLRLTRRRTPYGVISSTTTLQEADSTTGDAGLQSPTASYMNNKYKSDWTGMITMRKYGHAGLCNLSYLCGDKNFVEDVLPSPSKGDRFMISEFMNFPDQSPNHDEIPDEDLKAELEWIEMRMKTKSEHCVFVAYTFEPCFGDIAEEDIPILTDFDFLKFIEKDRTIGMATFRRRATRDFYTAYVFPDCKFADEIYAKEAPEFLEANSELAKALIVVTKD